MWLLEHDGTLAEGRAPAAEIAGETETLPETKAAAYAIRFGATQDGRGFSTARRLRAAGFGGRLVAVGPLEPDQARHAFQCGFDAVAVEDEQLSRHGREAWETALATSVTDLYTAAPASRLSNGGLWAARHAS